MQPGLENPLMRRNLRRLELYLRSLWGRSIALEALPPPGAGDQWEPRPRVDGGRVSLPLAWLGGSRPSALCRAAAAHASAHVVFGGPPFARAALKPLAVTLVSLLEDARIERLALQRFAGLRSGWLRFHAPLAGSSAEALLTRLARALLDDGCQDPDAWVMDAHRLFHARPGRWHEAAFSRELGGVLANELGQMRRQLNAKAEVPSAAYRDDSVGLWEPQHAAPEQVRVTPQHADTSARQSPTGEDAVSAARALPDPERVFEQPSADALRLELPGNLYPEWDERIAAPRSSWCTVREPLPPAGDPSSVEEYEQQHRSLLRRLRARASAAHPRSARWLRRVSEGDELDLDACVDACVARHAAGELQDRVQRRRQRLRADTAVLLLLDLSQSTASQWQPSAGASLSVLDVAKGATALLCAALARQPGSFALHGFRSNGRHQVEYHRFKDFGDPYGAVCRARLAAARGRLSTRVGTALRHAGRLLASQPVERRRIVLITDGEPSDIDVHDTRYLPGDARRAVLELRRQRIAAFCLLLGPQTSRMGAIFGARCTLAVARPELVAARLAALHDELSR